ncbi:MAG: hypothetical protein K2G28_01885 [Acetatifactor sp.]|nr:hypothetical protein [Acetatifactor sp.]
MGLLILMGNYVCADLRIIGRGREQAEDYWRQRRGFEMIMEDRSIYDRKNERQVYHEHGL